ncbi:MAG: exonuclease domain-containing protein, partial [Clostridia bacterium]
MNFLEALQEKTKNKYSYLRENKVNIYIQQRLVEITLLVSYEQFSKFGEAEQKEVEAIAKEILPKTFNIKIEYKKSYTDENVLKKIIMDFFNEYHATMLSQINFDKMEVKLEEYNALVLLRMPQHVYEVCKSDVAEELQNYLSHNTCLLPIVKIENLGKADFKQFNNNMESMLKLSEGLISVEVKTEDLLVGKNIFTLPKYIKNCVDVANNVVLCGKIESFEIKTSKKTGNFYYSFVLNDTTGKMPCKQFTKSNKDGKLHKLKNGDEVLVEGNIVKDDFIKKNCLLASNLSYCKIDYSSIKIYRDVNSEYYVVKPQPMVETQQNTLFDIETETPNILKGKTFVVFDLETTGLNVNDCDIIEIGAVKIVEGKVTEYFSTLVNPQVKLPSVITELTGIVDEDLKFAPRIDEVIGDFYKFCYDCTMIAHYASFDMSFIYKVAKECDYKFDN